ncbi:hypothetical protein ABTY20_19025 [Streptomyces sp. NPDC126497]|uniref:hypothetical protein n=1 Tax=Streptomyces sp. NPDC126497 TaxID=3155313 RepID=UPI003318A69F
MSRTRAATCGLLVPAALSLAMSADTSYRFLETALQITNETERMILCGVAEAAIIALTVYAWATRTKGPAYLAYAAVLVQAIPAFQVSGSVGGPVRVVLGPVLLAVLLHLLLGLELRMSGEKSTGLLASALRELRERLTAFLGIGRRGADSAAIARSRAADRAVDLADAVAAAKPDSIRHRRRAAKLAAAIDAARHGLDADEAAKAEAAIVARVVRRKSVGSLADIEARHDWALSLVSRDKEHEDVPPAVSPAPVVPVSLVPQDVPAVVSRDEGQIAVSPAPVVPEPVPAVVSRTRAVVPAVSQPRPSVRIRLDKTAEEIKAEGDTVSPVVSPARDSKVDVPEDKLSSVSAAVRFLMETGHSRDEVRAIVPTLPGHEGVKAEALKKAIQRAEKALAAQD